MASLLRGRCKDTHTSSSFQACPMQDEHPTSSAVDIQPFFCWAHCSLHKIPQCDILAYGHQPPLTLSGFGAKHVSAAFMLEMARCPLC